MVAPTCRVTGLNANHIAVTPAPNTRRRPQITEHFRPGVQHLPSVRGQQRRGTAEQYRKKIQRNGSQYRFALPDEAQALQQGRPGTGQNARRAPGACGSRATKTMASSSKIAAAPYTTPAPLFRPKPASEIAYRMPPILGPAMVAT